MAVPFCIFLSVDYGDDLFIRLRCLGLIHFDGLSHFIHVLVLCISELNIG